MDWKKFEDETPEEYDYVWVVVYRDPVEPVTSKFDRNYPRDVEIIKERVDSYIAQYKPPHVGWNPIWLGVNLETGKVYNQVTEIPYGERYWYPISSRFPALPRPIKTYKVTIEYLEESRD